MFNITNLCEHQKRLLSWCQHEMCRVDGAFCPVLLFGGPGVGKRTLARAVADDLGLPFVEIPLAGPETVLRSRLFGSEADSLRSQDSEGPPGELAELHDVLLYFSELHRLPDGLHHDFQRLVIHRKYRDLCGYQWLLPEGLIIILGFTEGVQETITMAHWLPRQFSTQIKVDVPRNREEVFEIIQKLIWDIHPHLHVSLSEDEAVMVMKAARWNLRTVREWIQRRITKGLTAKSISPEEIWEVIQEDVEQVLSRIEYCGSIVSSGRYRCWADQFPAPLGNIPFQILRKIREEFYISAADFQAAIRYLLRSSKIEAKGKVVFCKWQMLGRSGPMVMNELKNRGNLKLVSDLDLDTDPSSWPALGNGAKFDFVLADDFVGSGRTFETLLVTKEERIRQLLERYSAGSMKILIVAGYEDPIREMRKIAKEISSRISVHVFRLFGTKDRCFTDDSHVFPLGEEREAVMQFCREVAIKFFPPFLRGHPFGFGDVASLCMFQHTVPNNTLPIIWFDDNQEQWHPLFPARGVFTVPA